MSRKACRRKVWALVNPITHAIEGASITPTAALNEMRMRELAAIEAFARDQATEQEYHDMCGLQNMCVTMAASDIGMEAMDACDAARDALNDAKRRFNETGAWSMGGQGLQALRELFAWHDAQRTAVARSVYEAMVLKTVKRIQNMKVNA